MLIQSLNRLIAQSKPTNIPVANVVLIPRCRHRSSMKKVLVFLAALGISVAASACRDTQAITNNSHHSLTADLVSSNTSKRQRFDGVTITALTRTPPTIAEPLQQRAAEFESLTGAKVNIVNVPFEKLYEEIKTDFTSGTNRYDVMIFAPQWLVDYADAGYLEKLNDWIADDPAIEWDDVAPFFRNFSATYQGDVYTIPLDGDFQMVYYRSDLLKEAGLNPPRTWDEYLAIAKRFHDRDLNADGTADYGSCLSKKRNSQSYWMFWSVASAFLQSKGTKQGAFFDPKTMKPLVNNEAFAKALEIYKETTKYGPPNELEHDLSDTRSLFISGRCALTIEWGDIGTLAIDPEKSLTIDRVGAVILPGTEQVLDRETGKLVPCDKFTCPYAIKGINHAPYAAFGGWSGAIDAAVAPDKKAAGYALLSYMSQPAQANTDVTIGATGLNPYRISQFTKRQAWHKAGMSVLAASQYLGAIGVSLNSPNMVLELRIPQNQRYQQAVLDTVLADYLAGTLTTAEAMEEIEKGWEEITDKIGREAQLAAYRASLGLKP